MSSQVFTEQELTQIRADTPGCSKVVHLNNAGASLMPSIVADKTVSYLKHELNYGGYETAAKYEGEIESTYQYLARYLNCQADEIALTENATAAWQQAFMSIPFEDGDLILTSASEYASNYIPFLQLQKRSRIHIKPIPVDQFGQIDLDRLAGMMDHRVKLVAVTHVPTNGGLVNQAAEVGQLTRENGCWFLLDACQSVGQMLLNVDDLGCDFLSGTSRKFIRGPRGVGFLYAANSSTSKLEPTILDLHGAQWKSISAYSIRKDARKYENWEFNLAGVVGLGAAVKYMLDLGPERIWQRIKNLSDHLRNKLALVPGVDVQDLGVVKSGIVSFTTPLAAEKLKERLHLDGFNVSVIHPSHTLLDMEQRGLPHMIRASVHYYNTEHEIDSFAEQVRQIVDTN